MHIWIDPTKAQYYTGKSFATINRFISKYKNDNQMIMMEKNKPLINSEALKNIYPFINDDQMNPNDNVEKQKDIAKLVIQKQEKDIINKLIDGYHRPFWESSVLWVTIGFILFVSFIFGFGVLYRKELLNNLEIHKENIKKNYDLELDFHKKDFDFQKQKYKYIISNIKSQNHKITTIQKEKIIKLTTELDGLLDITDNYNERE